MNIVEIRRYPGFYVLMGCLRHFTCTGCGYTAEVSGGPDCGMEIITTTAVCLDCQRLFDVTTGESRPDPSAKPKPRRPLHCRRSSLHRVKRWRSGNPCPVCGAKMHRGEAIALWD